MALNKVFIKKGFWNKRKGNTDSATDGGLDLMRWFKGMADYLGIEYFDACCDTASIYRPVRFNATTGAMETYGVAGWAAASAPLTASLSLNFPSILNGASSSLPITLAGALVGDTVVIGVPVTTPATTGFVFSGSVLVNGTVTVTAFNGSGGTVDLGAGVFKATILR